MGQTLEIKDPKDKDPKRNGELSDLKADIEALRGDFSKMMADTSALAKTKSQEAVDRSREALNDAGEQLKTQKDKVEDRVRENPLAAVGIAFGVGVLFAALSRR